MKLLKIAIAVGLVSSGYLFGIWNVISIETERERACELKTSVLPSSEACRFFGYREECKGLRPRAFYAYHSHKFVACMYGKKGKAWGEM